MLIKKMKKILLQRKIKRLWKMLNNQINSNPPYVNSLERQMKDSFDKQMNFK